MIKRFHARLCIILLVAGLVTICISPLLGDLQVSVLYMSFGLIAVALYVKFKLLRCPYCGWGGAVPQWSKSNTIHCPKCGKAATYDH